MAPKPVVVVSDAHIGPPSGGDPEQFLLFLEQIPKITDHLVINGDLFDFWFEYRSVIPTWSFPTLAALSNVVRAGVRVTVTGGNHDRWARRFWEDQVGAAFHPVSCELELVGWRVWVTHGDRVPDPDFASRVLHRIIRHRMTSAAFRLVHPDFGIWWVRRFGTVLSRRAATAGTLTDAVHRQADHARRLLADRRDLDIAVFGHVHYAMLEECEPRRWFVNPGAWYPEGRYALIDADGPHLRQYVTDV